MRKIRRLFLIFRGFVANNKQLLPLVFLILGIVVFVGVFLIIKNKDKDGRAVDDSSALIEVELKDRPVASLTPIKEGKWLKLKVDKIVIEADSMDYELLYKVADGRTQGVPGTIKLEGQIAVERELLLGSESSGKFRYDEGVKEGTLTLRFRNEKGKLMVKFSTDFSFVAGIGEVSSVDGKFVYTLDEENDNYFVVMETFGVPGELPENVTAGPFGVFSSAESDVSGEVNLEGKIYRYDPAREELEGNSSVRTGIFLFTTPPAE